MQSDIEPFGNPVRVLVAELCKIGKSTLDVGCASCISRPLFESSTYVGMDFTLSFLKVAKKYGDVDVVQGTALILPFKDGAFDSCFVKDLFEHTGVGAFKTIMGEMWRVARVQIIIVLYGELIEKTIYKQTREPDEHNAGVPPYKGGIYYFNLYGRKEMVETVERLPDLGGYEVIEGVPLENTDAKCRTVIVIRKKGGKGWRKLAS